MGKEDLEGIAKKLVEKPKGILAMDESLPTIGRRFESVGLENTEDNRRAYRQMLITTEGLDEYISGVILFDETLYQQTEDGRPFVDVLREQDIIIGIKVDKGTEDLANFPGEKVTNGLEGLGERLSEYRENGALFTKWRAIFSIDKANRLPSGICIKSNAQRLAEYAALSQEQGLIPIVEAEVLRDGSHSLDDCFDATNRTLSAVFAAFRDHRVYLPGMLLKTNMVVPGENYQRERDPVEIAHMTKVAYRNNVPLEIHGILTLSGGLSNEDAATYLNAMNQSPGPCSINVPWNISFSWARALQKGALEEFARGPTNPDNIRNAQEQLLKSIQEASLATEGKYSENNRGL